MECTREKMLSCLLLLMAAFSGVVLTEEWKATVAKQLDAIVGSCVVVPCSFSHPKENLPSSRLRGIWHRANKGEERIFYYDKTLVLENFRGRTKMLGHLNQGNCTLEMDDVKDHDNGPFCFRIELARTEHDTSTVDKYSFVEDCATLNMLPEPRKPILSHQQTATEGEPFTITCSVTHTCPSHKPTLTWSTGAEHTTSTHRQIYSGVWESSAILTIIPVEKDNHKDITCTAQFHGGMASNQKMTLFVKLAVNYNHIIIPTVVFIGTALVIGAICAVLMKKYKQRIRELQSQDGTLFNRLSRMSRRFRTNDVEHSRANQRGNHGAPESNPGKKIGKPRCPSPKSQMKSNYYKKDLDGGDDYENGPEMNVYGNI